MTGEVGRFQKLLASARKRDIRLVYTGHLSRCSRDESSRVGKGVWDDE